MVVSPHFCSTESGSNALDSSAKPVGELAEMLSACSQRDQQQPGEHLVLLCPSRAVQPPGRWLWGRGVEKPFFSALWVHFSSSMPGLANGPGGGMWLLHFVSCYLSITAVKSINLFISLAGLSWSYVLLIEMVFCGFYAGLNMCTCHLYLCIYSFSSRSTSHTELTRKASSSEKETESVVVLDPVSTSGDQTSENALNQNKVKEEKSKPLHKETNVGKIKETDSSSC